MGRGEPSGVKKSHVLLANLSKLLFKTFYCFCSVGSMVFTWFYLKIKRKPGKAVQSAGKLR